MFNILFAATSILFTFFLIRNVLFWLYLWQVKEYRLDRMLIHLRETRQGKDLLFGIINLLKIASFFFYFATIFNAEIYYYFPYIVFFIYLICFAEVILEIQNNKIKLPVFTSRTIFVLVLTLLFELAVFQIPLLEKFLWFVFMDKIAPFFIAIMVAALSVPSDFYKDNLINKAIKIIEKRHNLLVIGITGSYGKGSTKRYLSNILSYKYNVLATYNTFNTPVGIAQTIIAGLTPKKQIFIVEMGAYKRGEIAEMCSMTKPKMGILTAINDQHISLFKNIETTMKAKYELIESLPREGLALFNGNNSYCLDLYKKTKKKKALYFVDYKKSPIEADVLALNVKVGKFLIDFDLVIKGKKLGKFEVNLIGAHNLENVLPGIYLASNLGMKKQEIREALLKIKPFEKTMEPFTNVNKTVLIDDTYNANPAAVKAAVDYMKIYKGKRVLVLQPMIELGKNAKNDHYEVAKHIGVVCTDLILTNKNFYNSIKKGIEATNSKCKLMVLSPSKALSLIEQLGNGDVVVFEGKEAGEVISNLDREPVIL